MPLDKNLEYVFRIGSDNQLRLFWKIQRWHYEFLAGGVMFDGQSCESETELADLIAVHGLTLDQFSAEAPGKAATYSKEIQEKMNHLTEMGIDPCQKHGLMSKNLDNTCEACQNTDYPDDFKGTEG